MLNLLVTSAAKEPNRAAGTPMSGVHTGPSRHLLADAKADPGQTVSLEQFRLPPGRFCDSTPMDLPSISSWSQCAVGETALATNPGASFGVPEG